MAQNEWIYDSNYKSWFYLKSDGAYAHQEWQLIEISGTTSKVGLHG